MRRPTATLLLVLALLPRSAAAQDGAPATAAAQSLDSRNWEPRGLVAVDQAGAGLRGYALPAEDVDVTRRATVTVHTVASNNFYSERTDAFSITQRYETHTVALGYRRGFAIGRFPRFEIGGQLQLIESDGGFLNGFILGFENLMASLSGVEAARNLLRTSAATQPPLGTIVTRNGRPVYQAAGDGSGFGDVSFVAKAMLREGDGSSSDARVSARAAVNAAGKSEFTAGNFAGVGVGVERQVAARAAFYGDLRASFLIDRVSQWNLPLKGATVGFSAGTEMKVTRSNSLNIQIDGTTTPYRTTGTTGFDKGYGDITVGVGHQSAGGAVLTRVYLRENMNLPFNVRWNLDPDLALGIKATIRLTSR